MGVQSSAYRNQPLIGVTALAALLVFLVLHVVCSMPEGHDEVGPLDSVQLTGMEQPGSQQGDCRHDDHHDDHPDESHVPAASVHTPPRPDTTPGTPGSLKPALATGWRPQARSAPRFAAQHAHGKAAGAGRTLLIDLCIARA